MKMKMEYFKPHMVMLGCNAFEGDSWDEFLNGDIEMKNVLSYPRCIWTTLDPDRKELLEP